MRSYLKSATHGKGKMRVAKVRVGILTGAWRELL